MSELWFYNVLHVLWCCGAICVVSAIILHLVGDYLNDRDA